MREGAGKAGSQSGKVQIVSGGWLLLQLFSFKEMIAFAM